MKYTRAEMSSQVSRVKKENRPQTRRQGAPRLRRMKWTARRLENPGAQIHRTLAMRFSAATRGCGKVRMCCRHERLNSGRTNSGPRRAEASSANSLKHHTGTPATGSGKQHQRPCFGKCMRRKWIIGATPGKWNGATESTHVPLTERFKARTCKCFSHARRTISRH